MQEEFLTWSSNVLGDTEKGLTSAENHKTLLLLFN